MSGVFGAEASGEEVLLAGGGGVHFCQPSDPTS